MKDGKKHGVFWFFKTLLTFALVIYTCVRCCMIVSDKHHAAAAENDAVYTLTPAQTVALYGTQIQGILYQTENSSPITITFDYAFPLNSIGYMDYGGGFDTTATLQNIRTILSNRQEVSEYIGGCNGIVYVASSTQWGGTDIDPFFDTNKVQLHCPFSINLTGITGITQGVFYSTTSTLLASEWLTYSQCTTTWLATPNNYTIYSIPSNSQRQSIYRPTFIPLPTYPYYSADAPLDETALQYFTGFYNSYTLSDPFDLRGFTLDAYAVQNKSSGTDIWIILSCPTLRSYTPPPETTTRPPETIPAATYPVATMPPDSTDVPANIINQNLITNNYQLNLIIGQLNLIYNQLKLNGELNARLAAALDADNNPGLQFPENTDIRQYMSNAFYQTGTEFVYSPEDLQSYTRVIPWLSSMFGGQTWFVPFAVLGTIGLIMIVFSYLVFRR